MTSPVPPSSPRPLTRAGYSVATFFEHFIYGGRWVLSPMYVGLLVTLVLYTIRFLQQLYDLCSHFVGLTENELMLGVLQAVDSVMVANLVVLIMVGSYCIFVRRMEMSEHDRPQWLNGIDSSTLKVKTGMSLVGVSSIHLLRDFIEAGTLTRELILRQVAIHLVFVVSTLALAFTGRLTHGTALSSPPSPSTPDPHHS